MDGLAHGLGPADGPADLATAYPAYPRPSPIFPTVDGLDLNRLATSKDIMDLQTAANREAEARRLDASWRGLTVRAALRDIHEAIFGTMADVFGNTKESKESKLPLNELVAKNNRLRGLGIVFIIMAIAWLF